VVAGPRSGAVARSVHRDLASSWWSRQDQAALLAEHLREDRCRARIAADGVDGFAKVLDSPPDLITLDIQMPRRSGIQFYRELKSNPALAEIPVVVVTGITKDGRDMRTLIRSFLEVRHLSMPDAYLGKPVDGDELCRVVRDSLRPSSVSA
jgi:CheY-like chemotaxis protein